MIDSGFGFWGSGFGVSGLGCGLRTFGFGICCFEALGAEYVSSGPF